MKKLFTALIGGTVLLIGVAMLVLPGPGLPIVAAGLAILATEFLWARRAWRKAKGAAAKVRPKRMVAPTSRSHLNQTNFLNARSQRVG